MWLLNGRRCGILQCSWLCCLARIGATRTTNLSLVSSKVKMIEDVMWKYDEICGTLEQQIYMHKMACAARALELSSWSRSPQLLLPGADSFGMNQLWIFSGTTRIPSVLSKGNWQITVSSQFFIGFDQKSAEKTTRKTTRRISLQMADLPHGAKVLCDQSRWRNFWIWRFFSSQMSLLFDVNLSDLYLFFV